MHVSINPSLILSCQPCPFGCSNVCGCRHPINVTEMIPDTQVSTSTPSLLPNLPTPSLTFLLPDSTSNVSFTLRCKGAILSTPSLQTFSQQPPVLMLLGRLCVWVFCCALHGELHLAVAFLPLCAPFPPSAPMRQRFPGSWDRIFSLRFFRCPGSFGQSGNFRHFLHNLVSLSFSFVFSALSFWLSLTLARHN